MTERRSEQLESALRTRLDGYWWTTLPAPSVSVAITGGPGGVGETVRALRALEPAPAILVVDEEEVTAAAWRAASWGCSSDVISVVGAGWLPPRNWLIDLARHFDDHATFAVTAGSDGRVGAARRRLDWRTANLPEELADLSIEGALVRPAYAAKISDRRGVLRSLIDQGGAVVVDEDRFDRQEAKQAPSPGPAVRREPPVPASRDLISVIVPTIAARAAHLERCLASISSQDLPREQVEVLVVPNGPGSAHMDRIDGADRVLPIATPSTAMARNHGARHAAGQLLVFVDDDVVLSRRSLRAHLSAQAGSPTITVGPYYPPAHPRSLAEQTAFRWWNAFLARMTRPGHRVTFVDVLTGNMGMPPALFARIGGFDESSRTARREDWEFGYRALSAGVPVRIAPDAGAEHAYTTSPKRIVHDAEREGFGDVLIVERYPELLEDLPLRLAADRAMRGSVRWRVEVLLGRAATGRLAGLTRLPLWALERTGQRRAWLWLLHRLSGVAYRSGMQRALGLGHRLPPITRFETRIDLSDPPSGADRTHLGRIVVTLDGEQVAVFHPHSAQWDVEEVIDHCALLETLPDGHELIERPPANRRNG